MRTSGLIFDVYDDLDGSVLSRVFPTGEVSENIKTAAAISPTDMQALPDDAFALVLSVDTDAGTTYIRKYACTDPGNTEMSVLYFLAEGRKHLDAGSRKVAAENLLRSCEWFELSPPEDLQKEALLGLALQAPMIMSSAKEMKSNLAAARRAGPSGTVVTPNQIEAAKLGEVANTYSQQGPQAEQKRDKAKASSMVKDGGINPYVALRVASPEPIVEQTKVSALNGKYPLDTKEQVQAAVTYFDKYASLMTLEDRRTFAINTLECALGHNVPFGEKLAAYGGKTYAPLDRIKLALQVREMNLKGTDEEVMDKRAALNDLYTVLPQVDPGIFCGALFEFDKENGLSHLYNSGIPDPYVSTFGFRKTADFSEDLGGVVVTGTDLQKMADIGSKAMQKISSMFGEDVAQEFIKDPVGIFQSMPREQKLLIARMG